MTILQVGDNVLYGNRCLPAKIIGIASSNPMTGEPIEFLVEFDDKDLIPPQMKVPSKTLLFVDPLPMQINLLPGMANIPLEKTPLEGLDDLIRSVESGSYKCNHEWAEYVGLREVFKYCRKCNQKEQ